MKTDESNFNKLRDAEHSIKSEDMGWCECEGYVL